MKWLKYFFSLIFAGLLLVWALELRTPAASLGEAKSTKAVELTRQADRSLTFTLSLQNYREDTVEVAGSEYRIVDFADAQFNPTSGEPQIPYHTFVVGIPVGATVSYQILATETDRSSGVRLLPVPYPAKVDGWPADDYREDKTVYDSAGPFPASLVHIDPPAFFRDQQIVRIQVAGVQFFPKKQELLKYRKIVLTLRFNGGRSVRASRPVPAYDGAEEELYRGAIVNYEQARAWRKARSRKSLQLRSLNKRTQENTYYKFSITDEGIYRIDGRFLQSQSVDLNSIDPAKIRLFNNGGLELPRSITAPRPDSLVENAIQVVDGGDGRFDPDDFILFYGRGLEGWTYNANQNKFSHYINHYNFANIYWLSLNGTANGKRMQIVQSAPPTGTVVDTYEGLAFIEEELNNPLRSGLDWYGRQFAVDEVSRTQRYTLELPNAVANATADLAARFVALNSGVHSFTLSLNDNFVGVKQFSGISLEQSQYLRLRVSSAAFTTGSLIAGTNTLQINYSHSTSFGQAYLDWVELLYSAQLRAVDDELAFTVKPDSGLKTYRVSNFTRDDIQLFDVSDYANVRRFAGLSPANGEFTFTDVQSLQSPKRYVALTPEKYHEVQALERLDLRDIKQAVAGAEFVIIAHDDFLSEAERLKSFRENGSPRNQLITAVVKVSDIYNNFSAGLMDPGAIRNFLQYTYEHWSPRPSYVLLLGDGDFDPKNIISRGDQNWIVTFQRKENRETIRELDTRATDSWYTYLAGNDFFMDMAIGRINAQTLTDARNAVDKIIAYESQPQFGTWRNTVTLVADDELITGGRPSAGDIIHVLQTEQIATGGFIPPAFDLKKIYLPEFPKVISASVGGVIKPEAREALIRQINEGTLIVNFVGHGNSTQWAHEVVFQQSDNQRVQNHDKLIFFMAATCDWALYDNPQRQSQAEELLLAENRGAIAILSSTRLVFAGPNGGFNRTFYRELFKPQGQTSRIGDTFVLTRMQTQNTVNDEKFHIYGDPTLRLAMPQKEAVITSITPDSIVALSTMEITGEVQENGQIQSDFDGTAFVTTFDSEKFVRNIPEAGSVQTYHLPGNTIYRGTVPVTNGRFTARFIVPKDISYGGSRARISTYFWDASTDGSGYAGNIRVSSTSSDLVDKAGPKIKLFFRGHENFTTGDVVEENVTLVAELADSISGINIAGEIGHRITLTIDPDRETCLSERNRSLGITSIDLTDLFRFNEGDFLRGTIEYPLSFPEELDVAGKTVSCLSPDGEQRHTLVLKAWDNSNNSSTASVEVMVVHEQGLVLREVMNYPNPMRENTTFTFIANREMDVRIKIYTISGQLIRTLEYPSARSGFNMVEWDGLDEDGDVPANGVYLYKVIARGQGTAGVEQKEIVGRLAVIR